MVKRKMSLPSNKPVMNETILMGLLRTACCSKVNAANKKEKIIIRARGNILIGKFFKFFWFLLPNANEGILHISMHRFLISKVLEGCIRHKSTKAFCLTLLVLDSSCFSPFFNRCIATVKNKKKKTYYTNSI